jgi:REP element-mobilizing transposase RayT
MYFVQFLPGYSPTKIVTTIKGIVSRKVFEEHPEVKQQLWGGGFWSDGYFVSTVSKYGNEAVISNYIKSQGKEGGYKQIQKNNWNYSDISDNNLKMPRPSG